MLILAACSAMLRQESIQAKMYADSEQRARARAVDDETHVIRDAEQDEAEAAHVRAVQQRVAEEEAAANGVNLQDADNFTAAMAAAAVHGDVLALQAAQGTARAAAQAAAGDDDGSDDDDEEEEKSEDEEDSRESSQECPLCNSFACDGTCDESDDVDSIFDSSDGDSDSDGPGAGDGAPAAAAAAAQAQAQAEAEAAAEAAAAEAAAHAEAEAAQAAAAMMATAGGGAAAGAGDGAGAGALSPNKRKGAPSAACDTTSAKRTANVRRCSDCSRFHPPGQCG